MSIKTRATAGLLEALGKLALAAADKRLDRSASHLAKIGPMAPSNPRRITLEDRAIRDLDQSVKLRDAAEDAFTAARRVRESS